ncbi:glucosaminidase domain-containing protein [Vagococcus carniphilus]|uniref:glucosaminidase domain-containing protein n=1 Tax=Vagococcus carniphilus TaxID=218144 RepID=UPI003BA93451
MTASKKNKHRKIGMFVGVSTTLFSVCGPILQSVVYAEEANVSTDKVIHPLPDATSVINFSTDFSSTTNAANTGEISSQPTQEDTGTKPEEGSNGSETGSSSSQSNGNSNSNGGNQNTGSSSSSNNQGSSSGTNSSNGGISSNSSNPSTGSSSSNGSISNNNDGEKDPITKPSSSKDEDDLLGKNINKPKDSTPIKYSRNQSTAEFIEEIGESARQIGQKNDLYASVMIAQAILESGSGNSGLSRSPNYNLFGIKGSYEGEAVQMPTLEDNGKGGMYTISAKFRKYPSYKESLEDYATLMTGGTSGRSTFYQGAWKSNTKSYKEATKYLTGRYATDTRYNDKLDGLIETYELTQYDQKKAVEPKMEKSKETEAFIKEISTDAKEIAGNNDLYASVLIADAIIQSSSGNNILAKKNNIFLAEGEYQDKSVEVETVKQTKKGPKLEKVSYKEYPSYEEAMTDHVKELKEDKDVYQEMTTAKKDTYKKVTAYMTAQNKQDRKYHKKLNSLIATYDLTEFDKEVEPKKVAKKAKPKKDLKKKSENIDMLNKIGQNMTDKLSESLEKPTKYQVTKN